MSKISIFGNGILFKFFQIDEQMAEKLIDGGKNGISEDDFINEILGGLADLKIDKTNSFLRGLIVDENFSIYESEILIKQITKNQIKKFKKQKLKILPDNFVLVSCNIGKGDWFVFEDDNLNEESISYSLDKIIIGEDAEYQLVSASCEAAQSEIGELDFDDEEFFVLWSDNEVFSIKFKD